MTAINLPDLVLDTIFCHVIGDLFADRYPEEWHECLMAIQFHRLPRYARLLLMQCRQFYQGYNCTSELDGDDRLPTLELFRLWLDVIPDAELDLSRLFKCAIVTGRPDIYDHLLDAAHPHWRTLILASTRITRGLVIGASRVGVVMLDRVWQLHCDDFRLPATAFPVSAVAVDNARDVATLDWWWAWHKQHGLPFKYAEAIYFAMAGHNTVDRLAVCHWWRDRAVHDGLVLNVLFAERHSPELPDEEMQDPDPQLMRPFDITDLATLGEHCNFELLEFWASLVDAGLLSSMPVPGDDDDDDGDPLWNCWILNVQVLEWWLQRHQLDGLPLPPIDVLLKRASSQDRVDTLDWTWQAYLNAAFEFNAPNTIEISRTTRPTVLQWWLDLHDAQGHWVALPALTWQLGIDDTCEDLQAFWDLQSRPCARGGASEKCAIRIRFTEYHGSSDLRLLDWLREHGQVSTDRVGIQDDYLCAFRCAWHNRQFDALDELVARDDFGPFNSFTFAGIVHGCLRQATTNNDTELLQWWHSHPVLHQDMHLLDLAEYVKCSLERGCLGLASEWLDLARQISATKIPLILLDVAQWALCLASQQGNRVDGPATLSYLAAQSLEHGGGNLVLPVDHIKIFLAYPGDRSQQLLSWLVKHGPEHGVAVPVIEDDEELRARWELVQRLEQLSILV